MTTPASAGSGGEVCAQPEASGKLRVSVRSLCAFAARRGDLDLRFTPSPSAQQGREGHRLVARRRGESYEAEISLTCECVGLTLVGRADGYDPRNHELEEIKTYRGRLEDIPANHRFLHLAQARLYAWMLATERRFNAITVSVVYLEINSQSETRVSEDASIESLEAFASDLCERYVDWARGEAVHRERRQRWLAGLRFPMDSFRPGQRELAAAVWRTCSDGGILRLQAPTGLGKTLGTLYPALRAMATRPLDRLAVLSARTTARQLALDALESLRNQAEPGDPTAPVAAGRALPLRAIEIVSREHACEHPDKACHGESCPLARGFYDRLALAREAAAALDILDQARLREVALAHRVCPYFLSMEMLRWCDVAIGDYHYWFDRHAVLAALTADLDWKITVLVDEAHQLVPRARAMYSESSALADLLALNSDAPPAIRTAISDCINQWDLLALGCGLDDASAPVWQRLDEVPEGWLRSLQALSSSLGEYLAQHAHDPPRAILDAYFRSLSFIALAEAFGEHSLCELSLDESGGPERSVPVALFDRRQDRARLTIRNVVPAPFLKPRLALADSIVMFSATMNPTDFDRDLLGLAETVQSLEFDSPFNAKHLSVDVLPVSTRLQDRERSLDRIVRAIAARFREAPGNYLAFFSSFDYLSRALDQLTRHAPDIPVWAQARSMTETDRRRFLEAFEAGGSGIGFAVLGGAFGEGIDLPGRRLIGAFVATLGMPQADAVNEAMAERMEALFGSGHHYTYVVPGLQKVIQAAGRVIRTPEDRGSLLLMDARYSWPRYRALLPRAWGLAEDAEASRQAG